MQYTQPFDQIDPNASYVNGNPATGVQGSIIPAGAIEQNQREIVAAITGAGLAPSGADLTQLFKAILKAGYCVAAGTANAITASLGTSPSAYMEGMVVRVKIATTNTGAVTINLNGLGAKNIVSSTGSPLAAGDLPAGAIIELRYDGTNFQRASSSGGGGGGAYYGVDTGTANAVVTTIAGAPATITNGMNFFIKKAASSNTGAMTLALNGAAAVSIINADGSAIASGEMGPGYLMNLVFDGTSYRFMNGATTTAVGSLTANAGEGIGVSGSAVVSLNVPGLSAPVASIANTDLFPFYSQGDTHHRALPWSGLLSTIAAGLLPSLVGLKVYNTAGTATYTPTAGARAALVFCTGGGGAGGSGSGNNSGGGAGGTAISLVPLSGVSTVTVTAGAGGVAAMNASGTAGGQSSFGSYAVATGGTGGKLGSDTQDGAGHPGAGTVGNLLLTGNPGNVAIYPCSGNGGGSFWGGGGLSINNYPGNAFLPAQPGTTGGGGGGGDGALGGAGSPGIVVVLEFS